MSQYAGRRDPRFVAIHRGGLLDEPTHRLLADWAADCAEHVLPLFLAVRADDGRPLHAIETARAQAARTAAAPAAVPAAAARGPWLMMSDIDNFRRINDVYGHAFGDQVLQAVAGAFGELMPSGATLARVGGESFAVLVPRLDAESALALAERLRERIGGARIRRPDHDEAEQVTLSLGIAPFHPGEAAQALVERARQALARAKSDGRNRTVSAA